jgi:hypothetical protein
MFFFWGLILVGLASFLLHTTTSKIGFHLVNSWVLWTLLTGLLLLVFSCTGCLGLKRQVVRMGRCGGRRLLSVYQVLTLGLMAIFFCTLLALRALDSNVPMLLDDPTVPYARQEQTLLAPYFDRFYFKSESAFTKDQSGYGWFVKWTTNHCPLSMDIASCTACPDGGTPYSDTCCPRSDLCSAGNLAACPYMRCRTGVARFLARRLPSIQQFLYIVLVGQLFLLLNTCLLICFNPRDSLEDLLTKTGIMVIQHDRRPPTPRSSMRRSSPRNFDSSSFSSNPLASSLYSYATGGYPQPSASSFQRASCHHGYRPQS